MAKVYIDPINFVCSPVYSPGKIEIESSYFNGKCKAFVEGHRLVPDGFSWIDENGTLIKGKYRAPWKPYDQLAAAQAQYEADLAEAAAAYQEGVNSI